MSLKVNAKTALKVNAQSIALSNALIKGKVKMPVMPVKTVKKVTKSKFPLTYFYKAINPNQIPINDLLQQTKYKDRKLKELLANLQDQNNTTYYDALKNWAGKIKKIDPTMFPKYKLVELGKMKSDQDINRELDIGHCTNIFQNYDPEMFQPIYCIKTPGKDEWSIVNGQHTATATAAVVFENLVEGVKGKDWEKFQVLVIYIETHSREKAREAFALLNGEMSLQIARYDIWKQHYLSVKLDFSGNPRYKHTYDIIMLLRKYGVIPLPEDHDESGQPGALTHLSGIEEMAKFNPNKEYQDYSKLEWYLQMRNKFLYDADVNDIELGFYGTIYDLTETYNIDRSDTAFEQCMEDIMAVVQNIFLDMPTLKKQAVAAYKAYKGDNYGVADTNGMGKSGPIYFAYQAYRALGGTFNIPKLHNLFVHKNNDALFYLDQTNINRMNDLLTNKIVRINYNLVTKKKVKKK
jgi:hypothetical protein